jgi:acyl transferase domain-containing protein
MPSQPEKDCDPRSYHTVVLSAHSDKSLQNNKRRLLQFLLQNPDTKLANLAYSTTARRIHHGLRIAFSSEDTEGIMSQLRDSLDNKESIQPVQQSITSPPPVIFLFTGQGSQYIGMGNELWRTCPRFKESLTMYQTICDSFGFPKYLDVIIHGADIKSDVLDTVQMQLAHVALELAVADLWRIWGVEPSLVLGHSLGEYSALCVGGVLSVSDTLYLVGKRAMLLQTKCTAKTHAMLAVSLSSTAVMDILYEMKMTNCDISCVNGPMATVISGPVPDVHALKERLKRQQFTSRELDTPYSFHSRHIEPILDEFQQYSKGIAFAKPSIPVMSSLTGTVIYEPGTFGPAYLARQAREPVNFSRALESSFFEGYATSQTVWIEVGPDPTCLGLVRSNRLVPSARYLPSMKSGESDWKTLSTSIAMAYTSILDIDWHEFHQGYQHCLSHLSLPHYAFDVKKLLDHL